MSRRAKVGALVVDVLANVGGFRRGVSGTKKDVKGLDSEVGRLNKTLSRLRLAGEAFVALRIGSNVISNLRATADEMDRTADISRKLGAATEELISMRHAAEQLTEVAASGLDMAMQRWTRRLAEAAAGTGEAQKAIAELNLDAKRLQGLTLTQQMLEVAGAMQKVEKQSDKLRIAFKFFDSEGAALVNLFNSPGELQKKLGEASSLGLTFS
ncbi:MAG: phage tail tape measure protein, partial [Solirubrobacterales bacterium]